MNKNSLNRFFLNESNDAERKRIISYLLNPANDLHIKIWMRENWDMACQYADSTQADDPDVKKLWENIRNKIQENESNGLPSTKIVDLPSREKFHLSRYAAAAALLIAIAFGLGYFLNPKKDASDEQAFDQYAKSINKKDVPAPTSSKAVLTLADGTILYLDSSSNGQLATQGNVNVLKNAKGDIIYSGMPSDQISYNTLTLPKGSKPLRLVLADGSLVWLNAESSVTYPTAFKGKERKVNITGEAYFEVAKNADMPFRVSATGMVINVLGTHFNVNTYNDESEIRITLLEGSVDITAGGKNKILKPGQQARIGPNNIQVANNVDINEVMAWKNGQFYFAGTDIKSIMRQIGKYYDVEVEYKDNIPYQFVAKISRDVNISEFLEKLELTNLIHFEIKGNKVTISRNTSLSK